VRDANRIEKRAHHRPLLGHVIQDEHPSGDVLGQIRHAGEVTRLAIVVEAGHRLGSEVQLLRDEQRGVHLIVGHLIIAPERGRRAKPLLRCHLFPQV